MLMSQQHSNTMLSAWPPSDSARQPAHQREQGSMMWNITDCMATGGSVYRTI
jgi:hypothetical protein